ncbi:MAG: hypothetical protein GTO41_10075, partial [Burkholderiales bacterium]|nr:hypothetical protein [Burkholderiales bacterium]
MSFLARFRERRIEFFASGLIRQLREMSGIFDNLLFGQSRRNLAHHWSGNALSVAIGVGVDRVLLNGRGFAGNDGHVACGAEAILAMTIDAHLEKVFGTC